MDELNTLFGAIDLQRLPFLLQVMVFISSVLMVYGLLLWLSGGNEQLNRRLKEIKTGSAEHDHQPYKEAGFNVSWAAPVIDIVVPKDEWKRSRIKSSLIQAGYRSERDLYTFYGAKGFLALVMPVAMIVLLVVSGSLSNMATSTSVGMVVGTALLAFYLPHIVVHLRTTDRQRQLVEDFPDAMDMLVVCVEAGLGLDAAIQRVSHELAHSHPELAEELGIVTLELRAGKSRSEALTALAERTGVPQVQSLVALLIQAEHFGTSIASALREHSAEMRLVRIQKAKETAAKLPVKMLFPIVFFIFPALFIVVLAPAAIRIYVGLIGGTIN